MTNAKLIAPLLSTLLIGSLGMPVSLSAGPNPPDNTNSSVTVVLDIAIDSTTLTYTRADAAAPGPQRGDSYLINGTVYPGFTLPGGDLPMFTPIGDGMVGSILISGFYTSDAAAVEAGASPLLTSSTHVLTLSNGDGMITQGMEGVYPQIRAVLGGTGLYSGAVGQVTEEVLGTNATGGQNLRFTFQVVPVNPQDNSATPTAQRQKAQALRTRNSRLPR
jgi:hypothetical protein